MGVQKKVLAVAASAVVFSSSLCFGTLLIENTNYEEKRIVVNKVENNYKLYIKGNNVIRLLLREKYHSCSEGEQVKRCGLIRDDVIKATNLTTNEDLKDYFQEDAVDVVNDIIAKEESDSIEIQTDWNNRYSEEDLISIFENEEKEIIISFKDKFDETDMLTKRYTVTFDAKNGSELIEVIVKENEKIEKPKKPTRKGYTFVEWQLDGKKYNFNKEVAKDITLVAKWKKKSKK